MYMEIKFVVTILHNNEIVDWTWDSDPNSENYGEEYPIYEDQPLYGVDMIVDGHAHSLASLPKGTLVKDIEYVQCTSVKEVCKYLEDDEILHLLWGIVETLGL